MKNHIYYNTVHDYVIAHYTARVARFLTLASINEDSNSIVQYTVLVFDVRSGADY
jgi:hypothetical protein